MKIYCSSCGEVRPVLIDDCRDAKTNEPFQDIVCSECRLVIASGTDIRRKPLTEEEIEKMRHLIDWTAHWSYGTFARAVEAAHDIKEE
jgi:hypothetical protein